MQIQVPIETLRQRKLFVATPLYGGIAHGIYNNSMNSLGVALAQHGIQMRVYNIYNESLIQRARNYCVQEFLDSDCTHMLFIDGDIGFEVDSVLTLLALQNQNPDEDEYDVICGAYPKKCISWEKIVAAVNAGVADENPNVLENFVGDYVFNVANGATQIRLDQPVEVAESGTGFMMIRRSTFEKFAKAHPELSYLPDHVRSDKFDGSKEITTFFDCIIDPESKRYLSEDYFFCHMVRKLGMKVWLCPWLKLKHAGSYVFGGSLLDLAAIGATPTADVSKLNKPPSKPPATSSLTEPHGKKRKGKPSA